MCLIRCKNNSTGKGIISVPKYRVQVKWERSATSGIVPLNPTTIEADNAVIAVRLAIAEILMERRGLLNSELLINVKTPQSEYETIAMIKVGKIIKTK